MITIRGGRAQVVMWIFMVAYIIIAYTHIKVASTSRPSSPSSHKRMDHDHYQSLVHYGKC
jgi:tRNA(Ile2) C34 agmatinyltransferase TiaS